MSQGSRLRWLRVMLVLGGIGYVATWLLIILFPAGFSWHPRGSHSEYMIIVIYTVLGIFLLLAARDPLRHRSLIWFSVWQAAAHGVLMAGQAISDPAERAHLVGDVPALLVGAIIIGLLMPRGTAAESSGEARQAA